MSEQFSKRLERALAEYVKAHVEFVLQVGQPDDVNRTGDALRKLIYEEVDGLLTVMRKAEKDLVHGLPMVALGELRTAIRRANGESTGLE